MTKGQNKTKGFCFPPNEEMEQVIKRGEQPNFHQVNIGLRPSATPLEKVKYQLCKNILSYKHEHHLSVESIAKKLGLSKLTTEHLLYSHIDKFSFEEILGYANNLNISCQVQINLPYEREKATAEA